MAGGPLASAAVPAPPSQFETPEEEIADIMDCLKIEMDSGLPSSDGVMRLRDLLRTRGREWTAQFRLKGGLDLITWALGSIADARAVAEARAAALRDGADGGGSVASSTTKAVSTDTYSSLSSIMTGGVFESDLPEVEVNLVHCLMLLLNGGGLEGVAEVTASAALLPVVANCTTTSPSAYVRGSGMRLMTVVAGGGSKGRDQVLKALDHVRLERDDPCRFVTLVDTLSEEDLGVDVKVDTMVLLNTILSSDDIDERVGLRAEMCDAGVLDALEAIKEKYGQVHLDAGSEEAEWESLVGSYHSDRDESPYPRDRSSSRHSLKRDSLLFIRDSDTVHEREAKSELATQIELFEGLTSRDDTSDESVPTSEVAFLAHSIYLKLEDAPICQSDLQTIMQTLAECEPKLQTWAALTAAVQATANGVMLHPSTKSRGGTRNSHGRGYRCPRPHLLSQSLASPRAHLEQSPKPPPCPLAPGARSPLPPHSPPGPWARGYLRPLRCPAQYLVDLQASFQAAIAMSNKARPKRRLVHWDPLEPTRSSFEKTVFTELQPNSVPLPVEKLRDAFEEKPPAEGETAAVPAKISKAAAQAAKARSLLDAKTKQNVGIALKRLRMKPAKVIEEIYTMSDRTLTTDNLLALREMAPDPSLLRTLQNYKGEPSELDEVTQLLLAISKVPRYTARMDSTIFIRAYVEDAERIEARVKMVHMAVMEALESKHLPKVLEIVLALGNFLNEGTSKGDAKGIKLASLLQLETVKTLDRKKTLLHSQPEVLELEEDLENCKEAATIGLDELQQQINQLRLGFKVVKEQLEFTEEDASAPPNDRFCEAARGFLQVQLLGFEELQDAHVRAIAEYKEAAARFGEDGDKLSSKAFFKLLFGEDCYNSSSKAFFKLLATFVGMLTRATREVRQWQMEDERKRRRIEKTRTTKEQQQAQQAAKGKGPPFAKPPTVPHRRVTSTLEQEVEHGSLSAKYEEIKEGLAREVAIHRPRQGGVQGGHGGRRRGSELSRYHTGLSHAFMVNDGVMTKSYARLPPSGRQHHATHRRVRSRGDPRYTGIVGKQRSTDMSSMKRLRSTTFLPLS
ncbi:hypothetical protein JKP88DRAFT_349014 [Tribonema minus]|uniref:FH2 domain-containing protein n=1 Tax=Tribonema minus TaxID=303371 RepID=A0A835Z2Y1_9STRA|nr:hypothetical protein JKP88DRAFT_349014 [Tribonema minus]